MVLSRPFKEDRLALSFHASLLQAIDGVMSLALCLQVRSNMIAGYRWKRVRLGGGDTAGRDPEVVRSNQRESGSKHPSFLFLSLALLPVG